MANCNNLGQERHFCDLTDTDSSFLLQPKCVKAVRGPVRPDQLPSSLRSKLIHALTVMRYCLPLEQNNLNVLGTQTVALLLKGEKQPSTSPSDCECPSLSPWLPPFLSHNPSALATVIWPWELGKQCTE